MHFIPVEVKKAIQQVGLEYFLFPHNVKIKRALVSEADKSSKNNKKPELQVEVQSARSKKWFLLEDK